jgi:hypothetical protein
MNAQSLTDLFKKAIVALIISGAAAWALWWAANMVR